MIADEKLASLSRKEWLETNGLGSFAAGTASGAATRRYHGLFVAALAPPYRRHVLLSKFEETLWVDGDPYPLSTNFWSGAVDPEGHRYVESFEARPNATWTYSVAGVEVERRVWMPHGRQGVAVTWRTRPGKGIARVALEVRPLVAFRSLHDLTRENDALDPAADAEHGILRVQPYADLPALYLHHNAGDYRSEPHWYRSFDYVEDRARGYEGEEDLFSHGLFSFDVSGGEGYSFVYASLERTGELDADEMDGFERRELKRRSDRSARASRARTVPRVSVPSGGSQAPALDRWSETFATRLAEAAEQFLVSRESGQRSVLAGYHWLGERSRDAFIALPGLGLVTGRWLLPYEVLLTFARQIDRGMIPNTFPEDGGDPDFSSVDASLWFVEAARRYAQDTNDLDFTGRELLPRIEEVVASYRTGTRHGIHVDPADGLLAAGDGVVPLTWMDAVVDGRSVTPRSGKAVEVNALWYNTLLAGAEIAGALDRGDLAEEWRSEAGRVRQSFNARFWSDENGWLFDVVDGPEGDDASLRPNQLFAIGLHHDVLDESRRRAVLDVVEERLLTPVGIRSLDPFHPAYRGSCEGGPAERDRAAFNGGVWAWLLGPFAQAYLKAHGPTPEAYGRVKALVAPLSRHLGTEGCIGQLSELVDGEPPHSPRGCVAHTMSVAEVARVLLERLP